MTLNQPGFIFSQLSAATAVNNLELEPTLKNNYSEISKVSMTMVASNVVLLVDLSVSKLVQSLTVRL